MQIVNADRVQIQLRDLYYSFRIEPVSKDDKHGVFIWGDIKWRHTGMCCLSPLHTSLSQGHANSFMTDFPNIFLPRKNTVPYILFLSS